MSKMRFPAGIIAALFLCSAVYMLTAPGTEVRAISQAAASGAHLGLLGPACSEKAWPYYENNCVRDLRQSTGRARAVRIVSTDRLPPTPKQQIAARFIDPPPISWASPIVLRFGLGG
jgi:hypothetical protein